MHPLHTGPATVVYLVRHAYAPWTPHEDRALSAAGRAGAAAVADCLMSLDIAAIYSSPYRRAFETISPLASRLGLKVGIEHDLRERELGDLGERDFLSVIEECWQAPRSRPGHGESNSEAQARGLHVLRSLTARHQARSLVLSTHGNLLTLILQAFDESIGYGFWEALTMPDIYALSLHQDGRATIRRILHTGAGRGGQSRPAPA